MGSMLVPPNRADTIKEQRYKNTQKQLTEQKKNEFMGNSKSVLKNDQSSDDDCSLDSQLFDENVVNYSTAKNDLDASRNTS